MPIKLPIIIITCVLILTAFVMTAGTDDHNLPANHWQQPLNPQGPAPKDWTEVEQSLNPESCAECHADKYEEWKTSLHAHAMSPGFVGQIITYGEQGANDCMECHAPLAEQKQAFAAASSQGEGHLKSAQGLAAFGNSCAGCHVRENRRYGPPQRDTGITGQSDPEFPHGGVFRTADFEKSSFCAACHQFPQSYAINGKPLENTIAEWQASPQAAKGISCQNCHMPDRKHLWRGIHDPEMVKGGLEATYEMNGENARFVLKSTGIGHAFPSYITPKVVMRAARLDDQGKEIAGSAVEYVIKRDVGYAGGRWLEYSDTRLLPGDTARLELDWGNSTRIRMWLDVYPDDYYEHEVYSDLLESDAEGSTANILIKKAIELAKANDFILFDVIIEKP